MSEQNQITLKDVIDEIVKTRRDLEKSIEIARTYVKREIEESEAKLLIEVKELNSRVVKYGRTKIKSWKI